MVDTREKFREMLNDIAATDGITKFNQLAEMTGINAVTFTRIKNNEIKSVSVETFKKLNAAFDNRYNLRWFQGDSPHMTVREAIEAKDKLPVSQIMPDSSAEIIASLKRELERQEKSFNAQLAAKDENIATKNAQLTDKDRTIEKCEQTIKALQDQIFDLRHLLSQKMTKDELDNYPFVIGAADDYTKPKGKRI
jgi:transcriptional regulator with XRE-family HTH domain